MENIRKYRDIKLAKVKKKLFKVRTKYKYYKVFHRELIDYRNEKNQIIINKSAYWDCQYYN